MERQDYIEGLRMIADFLESHLLVPLPTTTEFMIFDVHGKDQMIAIARQFGTCDKSADDSFFRLRKSFGPLILEALDYCEKVCTKVVVGTRRVEDQQIPAREAEFIPAHDEPIVEWRCPSLLAVEEID